MTIASLLFPELALIAIGWLINRSRRLPADFWEGAEVLVYFVLFPALLFGSITRSVLSVAQAAPMLLTTCGALAIGVAVSYSARWLFKPDPRQFASTAQCGFRFNSYMTLALAARLGDVQGQALAALIIGFAVPFANLAAVYPLARHGGGSLWQALIRNPLVLATLGGLLMQAVGVRLPEPIDATLLRMGQGALVLGLLCVGAGLRLQRDPAADPALVRSARRLTVWMTACKLLAMPAAALILGKMLDLALLPATIALMFASMPTSPASYVLANRMGGDGRLVATLITASTLASVLALPFWLQWR